MIGGPKDVVLITGASSGFGAITARSLAEAGYIVYASMREIDGSSAQQVEANRTWARDEGHDLHDHGASAFGAIGEIKMSQSYDTSNGRLLFPSLRRLYARGDTVAYAMLRVGFGFAMLTHGLPKLLGIPHGSMGDPLGGATDDRDESRFAICAPIRDLDHRT